MGGIGEMTFNPNGVSDPRRGWWVCMNSGGCVTEMTDGLGGADEGEIGLDVSLIPATRCQEEKNIETWSDIMSSETKTE
jgi:hypothetical protein